MTAFTILHTARSGSNWLCYMLAETGVAGLVNPLHCGLFIGYGDSLKERYPGALDQYLQNQTTPNGVTGCKTDWGYLDKLDQYVGSGTSEAVLARFTHFIHMSREDMVAQAVSRYVAAASGAFTSYAPSHDDFDYTSIPYDFHAIYKAYSAIKAMHQRNVDYFEANPDLPVYHCNYETLRRRPVTEIRNILKFLSIEYDGPVKTDVATKKQRGQEAKAQLAEQFRVNLGSYLSEPQKKDEDYSWT